MEYDKGIGYGVDPNKAKSIDDLKKCVCNIQKTVDGLVAGTVYVRTTVFVNMGIPDDIEFQVGDAEYPQDGDDTYIVPDGGRIRLIRNGIPQSLTLRGDYKYEYDGSNIIFTPNLSDEELIQIQRY